MPLGPGKKVHLATAVLTLGMPRGCCDYIHVSTCLRHLVENAADMRCIGKQCGCVGNRVCRTSSHTGGAFYFIAINLLGRPRVSWFLVKVCTVLEVWMEVQHLDSSRGRTIGPSQRHMIDAEPDP